MTDFRALCNELHSALYQCDWPDGEKFYALTERTRVALNEPKLAGPTLDCISELCEEFGFALNDDLESAEILWEICHAVLARWGCK
jgi:hypothetical protein